MPQQSSKFGYFLGVTFMNGVDCIHKLEKRREQKKNHI